MDADYEDKTEKAYSFKYDNSIDAMLLKVYKPDNVFPLYLHVDNGGLYRITKNKTSERIKIILKIKYINHPEQVKAFFQY